METAVAQQTLVHSRGLVGAEGRPRGRWAEANNVELAYVPANTPWLNRIEAKFQALRYFTLDGTDHRSLEEQNSMICRYIAWRNRNAHDKARRELAKRAHVA
jgi:hypothetical protein